MTRVQIQQKIAVLAAEGQSQSAEGILYQRMLTAQARLDAGTAAHAGHARDAADGTSASSASWIYIAAALALAAAAIYFLAR